jgi:hypothetical protein
MSEFIKGKCASNVDCGPESMHIALMATIAQVPFSARTTKKALRSSFDGEFKRQLAKAVDAGEPPAGPH